jgi:hypothetical protein
VKKEEMIRHFKWHKKRDESLQHGFMRYSTMDDCSDRFTNCQHNRKQTHYHCIKKRADGVSTLNDQLFIRPDTLTFMHIQLARGCRISSFKTKFTALAKHLLFY